MSRWILDAIGWKGKDWGEGEMAYTMFDDAAYEVQKKIKRDKRAARWQKVKSFCRRIIKKEITK